MASILLVGDIHVTQKNTDTIKMLFTQVKNVIQDKKISYCIVMGDILHTHEKLHTTALNCAVEFLRGISKLCPNTFVLVGNHDYINNSQFLSNNHWMNCLKHEKLTIVDTVICADICKEKKICLCPYVPDGKFITAISKTLDDKKIGAYFSHVCINGMKMGGITVENADDWKESYPSLFVGHEHTFQVVSKNCICTGSCTSTSFSESSDKYLIVVNIPSKGEVIWDKITLDLPRKKTLYFASVQDLKTQNEEKKLLFLDKKSLCEYKIIVHGHKEMFDAFTKTILYKNLTEKVVKIIHKEKIDSVVIEEDVTLPVKKCEDFFSVFASRFRETNPKLIEIYNECLNTL